MSRKLDLHYSLFAISQLSLFPSSCAVVISVISTHIPRSFLSLFPVPPPISRVFAYFIIHPRQPDERCVAPLTEDIHKSGYLPRVAQFTDEQSRDVSTTLYFFLNYFFPSSSSTVLFSLSLNLFFCILAFLSKLYSLCIYSLRII